jgi:hypothetical protein
MLAIKLIAAGLEHQTNQTKKFAILITITKAASMLLIDLN